MAFAVSFYTFSKRQNSTMTPTTAALSVNCQAKLPLDLLNPTIQLQLTGGAAANPTVYNYAYIASFSRYYRIATWRNAGPIWEADLRCDALASWKTAIGNQSCYIYRSASAYDNDIGDNLYPVTSDAHRLNIALDKPFTIGGASASGATADTGVFILGIVSSGGTQYYGFTSAQLVDLLDYLFSDQYYEAVLTDFGADEYPEAKVAINPMQYISSVRWIPMGVSTAGLGGYTAWTLKASSITGVVVGNQLLSTQTAYAFFHIDGTQVNFHTTTWSDDIQLGSDFWHPQADARGDWLKFNPYTTYEVFYPPFGLFDLDPAEIADATTLSFRLTIDVWTGKGNLDVIVDRGLTTERIISRMTTDVAVDVPLSNILVTGSSTMQLVQAGLAGLQAAINVDPQAFLSAEMSAGKSMVTGRIPHLSSVGTQGSTAPMEGSPKLKVTHWLMADDDLTDFGRPLYSTRTISAIPGYIKCDSDHVAISCTQSELAEIKAAMSAGFYYE